MRRVILESPYTGDISSNESYARRCLHDCLMRNEAPLASHLLYTQPNVLDDSKPVERKLGIAAGHEWYSVAEACVVYIDRGMSSGMLTGIEIAKSFNLPIEERRLSGYETANPDRFPSKFTIGKCYKARAGSIFEITAIDNTYPAYRWMTGVLRVTVDGHATDGWEKSLRSLCTWGPEGHYAHPSLGENPLDLVEEVPA